MSAVVVSAQVFVGYLADRRSTTLLVLGFVVGSAVVRLTVTGIPYEPGDQKC